MTKKQVKEARKDIQKLIKENKKQLLLQINKKHPKLIRLLKKSFFVSNENLCDASFYQRMEDSFEYFYKS